MTTTKTRNRTYTAVYERDSTDGAWNVHVKGLSGCQTYGRSVRQAQSRIREALAAWLDQDPSTLTIRHRFPEPLASVADEAVRARTAAERAEAKARQQTVDAVNALTQSGLSRRDTAEILGLSHQRIQQLLDAS